MSDDQNTPSTPPITKTSRRPAAQASPEATPPESPESAAPR